MKVQIDDYLSPIYNKSAKDDKCFVVKSTKLSINKRTRIEYTRKHCGKTALTALEKTALIRSAL